MVKVIATDLDRTLLPNGNHRLTPGSMEAFTRLIKSHKITLIFVTGRNARLVEDAMQRYDLAKPAYCISDVGTRLYTYQRGRLVEDTSLLTLSKKAWGRYTHRDIRAIFAGLEDEGRIRLQDASKQNDYKVSYYIDAADARVVTEVRRLLSSRHIHAEVISSVDINRGVGLLDILPRTTSKLGTLQYVLSLLDVRDDDVLYSGDSGNDLLPLTAGYYGVLVKNASDGMKARLRRSAKSHKVADRVYIARGGVCGNGNYVNGIIEGGLHFGFFSDADGLSK